MLTRTFYGVTGYNFIHGTSIPAAPVVGIERKILDSVGSSKHTVSSHTLDSQDEESVSGFLALIPELYGQAAFYQHVDLRHHVY